MLVQPHTIPPTSPDPDDDIVLATALAAKADLLVSSDQHLLSLQNFSGIPICKASDCFVLLSRMAVRASSRQFEGL